MKALMRAQTNKKRDEILILETNSSTYGLWVYDRAVPEEQWGKSLFTKQC